MDAVGCRTDFSAPISVFVFDILRTPSGCIKIMGAFPTLGPTGYGPATFIVVETCSYAVPMSWHHLLSAG